MTTFLLDFMKGDIWVKKMWLFSLPQADAAIKMVHKLSSFGLVVLLVDDKFTIDLLVGGQLSLVISFENYFLFVMSGTGFIPSNFNADASDSKLSGRNVPIVTTFVITLC